MPAITFDLVYKAAAILVLTGLLRSFYLLYRRRMHAREISDKYGLVSLLPMNKFKPPT